MYFFCHPFVNIAGSCEDGIKPSGSIKGFKFLDELTTVSCKEGLRSMELYES
jgi:hypothetical protein